MMKYKLVTLPRQTAKMPILAGSGIGPLLTIPTIIIRNNNTRNIKLFKWY